MFWRYTPLYFLGLKGLILQPEKKPKLIVSEFLEWEAGCRISVSYFFHVCYVLEKGCQWLSHQRGSELMFENTILLLYTKEHFDLFLLLKMACWVAQTCTNASIEKPRSFVSDDVHDTGEGCRDRSPEEVYLLFWLSSETRESSTDSKHPAARLRGHLWPRVQEASLQRSSFFILVCLNYVAPFCALKRCEEKGKQ